MWKKDLFLFLNYFPMEDINDLKFYMLIEKN